MKTFEDLEFKKHEVLGFGFQAEITFENGYGVSVINGDYAYSSQDKPYEIAIKKDGSICYDTYITNDVIGYQTKDDVTKVMAQVQNINP